VRKIVRDFLSHRHISEPLVYNSVVYPGHTRGCGVPLERYGVVDDAGALVGHASSSR
jgi:hypothetical protein